MNGATESVVQQIIYIYIYIYGHLIVFTVVIFLIFSVMILQSHVLYDCSIATAHYTGCFNILGGPSIGHSKQKYIYIYIYIYLSYS
jgi:hypothetical protein